MVKRLGRLPTVISVRGAIFTLPSSTSQTCDSRKRGVYLSLRYPNAPRLPGTVRTRVWLTFHLKNILLKTKS
jgi:hypothetical protein